MIFCCGVVVGVVSFVVKVEVVTLAREPEFAVVLLVLDDVHQVGKHFTAVAANQDVGAACKTKFGHLVFRHSLYFEEGRFNL